VQPVNKAAGFRGLPDIAMDASIETGAETWGGQAANGACTPCVTGGTSLASPLAAGSWARFESAHGNRLGFAAALLYRNFQEHTAGAALTGPPPTAQGPLRGAAAGVPMAAASTRTRAGAPTASMANAVNPAGNSIACS